MQATSVSIGTLSERLHDLTAWFWAVSDVGSSLKSLKLGDFSHRLGPSGACERSCDLGGTSASFEWWLEGWHRVAGAMQKIIQGCVLHATILNIHIYINILFYDFDVNLVLHGSFFFKSKHCYKKAHMPLQSGFL
jgi:hypothetical protein